ncbi:MAG: hypothetical protein KatS3mg087_1153 [Patescibacteria group bacterium]|nr:MAG: hypothetical protein KatS3mg087_1153 [Patescibacteria group bacterium]
MFRQRRIYNVLVTVCSNSETLIVQIKQGDKFTQYSVGPKNVIADGRKNNLGMNIYVAVKHDESKQHGN